MELDPEWLKIPAAVHYSGCCRSLLYERIASGEIRSVCVRRPGAVRGLRLVSRRGIDAFLNRLADEQAALVTADNPKN